MMKLKKRLLKFLGVLVAGIKEVDVVDEIIMDLDKWKIVGKVVKRTDLDGMVVPVDVLYAVRFSIGLQDVPISILSKRRKRTRRSTSFLWLTSKASLLQIRLGWLFWTLDVLRLFAVKNGLIVISMD